MSWSYRTDRSDEVYTSNAGPVVVTGAPQADAQGAAGLSPKNYPADGAIDVRSHVAILTKGSAGAYTLATPTVDGIELKIVAGTGFAHVVTCTSGVLQDGTTGAKVTFTSVAFAGCSVTLFSSGGKWMVIAKNLGTIA